MTLTLPWHHQSDVASSVGLQNSSAQINSFLGFTHTCFCLYLLCILCKLTLCFTAITYFCIFCILSLAPTAAHTWHTYHLKSLLFQTLGGEHKEQIDRWNFKTLQGQQLTKKQRRGKCIILSRFLPAFIKCSLCGQCRDKVSFQALGAYKCLAPFEY